MALEHYKALRVLALAEVVREHASPEYSLRRIYRWYGSTYGMSPLAVEELPTDDVLQHYYEHIYESLLEDEKLHHDLRKEMIELSETDAEAEVRKVAAEKAKVEEFRFAKDLALEEVQNALRRAKKKAAAEAKAAKEGVKPRRFKAPEVESTPGAPEPGSAEMPGAPGPGRDEIKMTFIDLEELERLSSIDGLGAIEPLLGLD